jgi:predicted alpha/beta-fold hydrolase
VRKFKELEFHPMPLFSCPHRQTLGGALIHFDPTPISVTHMVTLSDGDQLTYEVNTPKNWKSSDLTVFFVHGMCGSQDSVYLVRLVNRLEPLGIRCIRLNLRGSGSGKDLARKIYHSGCSDDVLEALKLVHLETPDSPVILVGFSLGANISLKLVGELSHEASKYLKAAICVSPPADLRRSIDCISTSLGGYYQRHFCKVLKTRIAEIHRKFEMDPFEFPEQLTFNEFDRLYKIPTRGFKSVDHYYDTCCGKVFATKVAIPCRILFAEDDPFIPHDCLDDLVLPSNVELYKTKMGGHIGFLGDIRYERGFRWLDSLIEEWIKEMGR